MIKLYDGQITDLLPEKIAQNTEVRCVSYAIQKEHQRLMDLADKTRTLSVVEKLPERVLDILAVELRTPYYQENMDVNTKRNIIKKTLQWHSKSGTAAAVAELVEAAFGIGKVIEWFDFEEPPYTPGTFDIETNARFTEDSVNYFMSVIQRIKNTRSHIRRILTRRRVDTTWRAAIAGTSRSVVVISNTRMIKGYPNVAVMQRTYAKTVILQ